MIRTIALGVRENAFASVAADTPASMEITTHSGPTCGARSGRDLIQLLRLEPEHDEARPLTRRIIGDGRDALDRSSARSDYGHVGEIDAGFRQPSTIAPAILPHPTSQAGAGNAGVMTSGLSGRVDQRRRDRLASATCRPTARTGIPGRSARILQVAASLIASACSKLIVSPSPTSAAWRKTIRPGSRPKLEMAKPQLLVDQPERFIDCGALFGGNLDVRKCQELQHLVFVAPYAAKLILRPASGRRGDDLAIAGSLAGPAARLEILLQHLDRSAVVALVGFGVVGQDLAPFRGLAAALGLAADGFAADFEGLDPRLQRLIFFPGGDRHRLHGFKLVAG